MKKSSNKIYLIFGGLVILVVLVALYFIGAIRF